MMNDTLTIRIILENTPLSVDYALQQGSGSNYTIVQKQRAVGKDLVFECSLKVKDGKNGAPDYFGPFVQGPAGERFIYIGIGAFAGQEGSCWNRRLKVPLRGISHELLSGTALIETHVAGTAKDGSPTCATVKPFAGWKRGED